MHLAVRTMEMRPSNNRDPKRKSATGWHGIISTAKAGLCGLALLFPWLPRDFFLNKLIGRLTWRLSKKYRLDPLNR